MADWWLEMAYLAYRDPVTVWSSPGLVWPHQNFTSQEDMLWFAASAVAGALHYKLGVDNASVPVDRAGGLPLDMQQYFKVFGTSRIPESPSDRQSFSPTSTHIVVIFKNHFHRVEVYSGSTGAPLTPAQIQIQLQQVVAQTPDTSAPGVGVLTSLPRDDWVREHALLCGASHTNKTSL